ncbi:PQQ-binding-like beta-propeller repeat protein [Pedococcus sp.]|uniref:outer membrane protein assembly factor BamB family protein n=1 Tax=Pedococcus sp. TaxID=2860345 RepID=UPI002E12A414|nr:PQQ-binding-like beta-propeller repeat protein [Pedococcus sp.]
MVVPVTGRAGIPAGATAVVVNLTEASATATGYLTLYPELSSRPGTSNLDFVASHVSSVEATVSLGSTGGIVVYNSAGSVNAVLDVVGYYTGTSDSNPKSVYNPQSPTRLVDTRHSSAVLAGHYLWVDLTVPQTTAIALNVTVTGPSRAGYLEVWPGAGPQPPQTSALNFVAGQTVANMAITRTALDTNNGDPSFSVGNFSDGPVNIVVDVVGFYTPLAGGGGSIFKAITPTRVVDTRIGRGLPHPLSAGQSAAAATSAVFGDGNTVAMVANATGLDDRLGTYLSVYPADTSFPGTSSLNLSSREVRSNMVMTGLSMTSTRSFAEYNSSGTLDTLIDAVGYFESTTTHPSTTTLTSTSSTTTYDTALTLTASVAGASGPPTGQVTFTDGSNGSILAVTPIIGGVAHLTTAALAPGTRHIVVTYSGDNVYSPSASASLAISVAQASKTVATAFQNDPRHDGMDTSDTFNPATLHQAWSTNLNPSSGTANISYPLIAGGRVFVTVAKSNGDDLYALDATTGSVDWFTPMSSTYGWLGLTYDGGQVFTQNSNGNLTAYDAATGHANWSTAPGQYSFSAPPTAYDGVLYASGAGSGGTLFALSEATGKLVWSAPVANGDVSSPAVDDSGVYEDYACDLSSGFSLSGTNRWTQTYGCEGGGGATSVLNGANLYLRGGNQGPGALIVSTATGVSSGTFGGTSMPAFDGTNMYLVSGGALQAVDKAGSPAHWSFTGDGSIDTTAVTTNGIVFTGSSNGNLYGIDSSTGAQVWTAVAPGPVSTSDAFGMHTGLAAASGLLAVPAGGFVTVYTN